MIWYWALKLYLCLEYRLAICRSPRFTRASMGKIGLFRSNEHVKEVYVAAVNTFFIY